MAVLAGTGGAYAQIVLALPSPPAQQVVGMAVLVDQETFVRRLAAAVERVEDILALAVAVGRTEHLPLLVVAGRVVAVGMAAVQRKVAVAVAVLVCLDKARMGRLALPTEAGVAQEVLESRDQLGQEPLAAQVAHTAQGVVGEVLQMVVMVASALSGLSGPEILVHSLLPV